MIYFQLLTPSTSTGTSCCVTETQSVRISTNSATKEKESSAGVRAIDRSADSPAEVPVGDGAGDHELLAGEDELADPDEAEHVVPPEVADDTLLLIRQPLEALAVVGRRRACGERASQIPAICQ